MLSCGPDQGRDFMESSLLAGVIKPGNKLLLPCYGLEEESLDRFRYSGAEVTTLRMEGSTQDPLQSSYLLDLLTALTEGILSLKLEGHRVRARKLSCADSKAWQQGLLLVDRIRNNKFFGRSGTVIIDQDGQRRNFSVSVRELTRSGLVSEGVWSADRGYLRYSGREDWPNLFQIELGR